MSHTLLIIGITGGAGLATAKAALKAGFHVRALHRDPSALDLPARIALVQGDAMNRDSVVAAAKGADFILHAANPPGYRNWDKQVIPMAMNAVAAARAHGARLFLPGNIYNFGQDAMPLIREGAPQNPISRKGAIRVELERMIQDAGVRATILRAGDFFGGHAPASWFQTTMIRPGKPVQSVMWPGSNAGHAFAYLPDMGACFVRLMQQDAKMQRFEDLHFAGHHLANGRDFARAIARAADKTDAPIRALPWPVVGLLRPFAPLFREICEMRYLWQVDARLDNSRLVELIGSEPHTPLDTALITSLQELGCIPANKTWSGASASLFSG